MFFASIQMMIGIVPYLTGMIIIGIWKTRRSNTFAEASDMSGWLLMGLPGAACFAGIFQQAFS